MSGDDLVADRPGRPNDEKRVLARIGRELHHRLGDPARTNSFSSRRREFRFRELVRRFPKLDAMRVLDLGGTPSFWHSAPVRPKFVTTVNLDEFDSASPWLRHVVADACEMTTLELCDGGYDLVVSNSLIEHVGGYQRRRDFARTVMTAAPAYWVQTPDRYFPVEPHYLGPGFQFLPVRLRAEVVRRWPLAHERVYTTPEALAQALMIELISATELRHLFPGSTIWHERIGGISKSIVAISGGVV